MTKVHTIEREPSLMKHKPDLPIKRKKKWTMITHAEQSMRELRIVLVAEACIQHQA